MYPEGAEKPRIFLARSQLTWMGTFQVVWQIAITISMGWMLSNDIIHAYLLPGFWVASVTAAGVCFLFNSLYWGPSAGYRPGLTWRGMCRRVVTETAITYEKRMLRLLRCYNDQWIQGWVLATTGIMLMQLTRFYWRYGVHAFQPLLANDVLSIMLYDAMKQFQGAQSFIGACTVLIAMYTHSDLFKHFVLALGESAAVQVADGSTTVASQLKSDAPDSGSSVARGTTLASGASARHNMPLTGAMSH